MKTQRTIFSLIISFSLCLTLAKAAPTEVPFTKENWRAEGSLIRFEHFEGRATVLTNGNLWAQGISFRNGTIEVDVWGTKKRSFGGIVFRNQSGFYEETYMRLHKGNQVDAIQYTPVLNHESNWQLFRQYQSFANFRHEAWNHFKIVTQGSVAQVYLNGRLVLTIDRLESGNDAGEIGIFALFETRFSNFKYSNNAELEPFEGRAYQLPQGLVRQWRLSEPQRIDLQNPQKDLFKKTSGKVLAQVEEDGILLISKHVRKASSGSFETNSKDSIFAHFAVKSESDQRKRLSFDFSDELILFQDGVELYRGNNAFRTKGVQFMGHLEREARTLNVALKKGRNDFYFKVIERANGWGLTASWEDLKGLQWVE